MKELYDELQRELNSYNFNNHQYELVERPTFMTRTYKLYTKDTGWVTTDKKENQYR